MIGMFVRGGGMSLCLYDTSDSFRFSIIEAGCLNVFSTFLFFTLVGSEETVLLLASHNGWEQQPLKHSLY